MKSFFCFMKMYATTDSNAEIGCSQSSTSFADIIINNDNAVADGLITGFAQFVHDPKYLKETVSIFNRQKIPKKFADGVVLRRIETQQLDNIWDFPLNLECPSTIPLPWTIIDASVKSKQSNTTYEFNIMRIVDFIGRNYVRIVLPEVNTTTVTDSIVAANVSMKMASKYHMYLGAWHRDLIPRIIEEVSFYPRSNSHKLFNYTGYDIFVHNILFGNAAKRLNDMMSGEDSFELCYDPYAVHGSALGLASYRGVDQANQYGAWTTSDSLAYAVSDSQQTAFQDGWNDAFIVDTFMTGEQFAEIYRRGVWYEAPTAKNYHARHSIHSRRFVHATRAITFTLDILPFGYSIASALPSAAIAGDCGFIRVKLYENWFDRAFYLTKLSDVPLLHPVVNHTHYVPGDIKYVPGLEMEYVNRGGANMPPGSTNTVNTQLTTDLAKEPEAIVTCTSFSITTNKYDVAGPDAWMVGWVNPLSIGRYGNPVFWNKLSGMNGTAPSIDTDKATAEDLIPDGTIPNSGAVVNGYPANLMEGVVYSVNAPTTTGTAQVGTLIGGQPGGYSGTYSSGAVSFGTINKTFNSLNKMTGTNTSISVVSSDDIRNILSMVSVSIYKPSDIDNTWYASYIYNIGVKLLQVGYQTLPCVREFLSKLPNIYLTTEWSTMVRGINETSFDINNDLYIQGIMFWFTPIDDNGIESMRLYPHQLINHEAPVLPALRLMNEQSQGTTVYTWDMMNEISPHLLGCHEPLLENMGLVGFNSKLASNTMPYAYYDSNISGYLKCTLLEGSDAALNTVQQTGAVVNLRSGKLRVVSFGTNGVAVVNLNMFRLIF